MGTEYLGSEAGSSSKKLVIIVLLVSLAFISSTSASDEEFTLSFKSVLLVSGFGSLTFSTSQPKTFRICVAPV